MGERIRVGYIGVGLMGHGAARHILLKGHPLTILGHRNRAPVDDLVAQGATEAHSPVEVAQASEVVFLCLPSSVEVEATLLGENGVLEGLRPGTILVDSTSADPTSTRRLGRILAERRARGRQLQQRKRAVLPEIFVGIEHQRLRKLRARPRIEGLNS